MSKRTTSVIATVAAACLLAAMTGLAAEDTLPAAKDLYSTAAYQEALAMLDRLKATNPTADVAQEIDKYRAFCLFAIGNTRDAEQTVTEIMIVRPRFRLNEDEASPRVVAAFRDVRRRQLPALIEQAYARGREAYERKQTAEAIEQFRLMLDLADDPDGPPDQPLTKDMKTLAAGFMSLAEAAQAADAKALADARSAAPPVVEKRAPTAAVTRPYYTAEDGEVVPPIAVDQRMPAWPANVRVVTTKGVLELLISPKGEVEAATMRVHMHPAFDALVLERAKAWRYRPAVRQGEPVTYLKRIEIEAMPPGSGSGR